MPTTRKPAHYAAASGTAKQSKLNFAHRVTKPVATKSGKDILAGGAAPSPLSKEVLLSEGVTTTKDDDVEEIAVVEEIQTEEKEEEEQVYAVEPEPEPEPEKSDAELRAEKITDAQVGKYWGDLEAERVAKRVHQEDLDVGEKVLRYFDVSSQYGPCIGIQRMKRWMRAERLGLNPPIEVLAVLLKEEKKGVKGIERAHMDAIMNSTAVGATA